MGFGPNEKKITSTLPSESSWKSISRGNESLVDNLPDEAIEKSEACRWNRNRYLQVRWHPHLSNSALSMPLLGLVRAAESIWQALVCEQRLAGYWMWRGMLQRARIITSAKGKTGGNYLYSIQNLLDPMPRWLDFGIFPRRTGNTIRLQNLECEHKNGTRRLPHAVWLRCAIIPQCGGERRTTNENLTQKNHHVSPLSLGRFNDVISPCP